MGSLFHTRRHGTVNKKALRKFTTDGMESYNELPQFLQALTRTNLGTIVDVQTTNSTSSDGFVLFKYALWAFKLAIDGFRYCLPVILPLTIHMHVYDIFKGFLLLAVRMNGNKEILQLAYSIVDSENGDSLTWFMRLVAKNVFDEYESICNISDMHRGIGVAFNEVPELHWPRFHRHCCLRHIRSNVMTKFKNTRLKSLVQ